MTYTGAVADTHVPTLDELTQPALDTYRAICHADGSDPDIELVTARLNGHPAWQWVIVRVRQHHNSQPAPDPSAPLPYTVDRQALRYHTPDCVWALYAANVDHDERDAICRTSGTPDDLRLALTRDPHREVRAEAVRALTDWHPALAPLATDPDPWVRQMLATGHAGTPEIADILAHDPNFEVREAVARNENTPTTTLTALADDPDQFVRRALVRNPSTPRAALDQCASDVSVLVRREYATSRRARSVHLDTLAHDPDPQVRRAVAAHSRTPASALEALRVDTDSKTREIAKNPVLHRTIQRRYIERRRRR